MICQLSGTLTARGDGCVVVTVGGIGYEVQVPVIVAKALETAPLGEALELQTIYYLQMEQTKATPVLIGFQNVIEREFFEKLLTVPKMGPKGAMNAFARPLSTIATAIETADHRTLQGLPGVGQQKARDMVATLQGKVAKFALMEDTELKRRMAAPTPPSDIAEEALQLLVMLGHKRGEAERMVAEATQAEPNAPDAESLVRVIYRRQQERK